MTPQKGVDESAKLTGSVKYRVKKENLRPLGQSQCVIVPSDHDYAFASLLSAFTN